MVKKYGVNVKIIETAKKKVADQLRSYTVFIEPFPELQKLHLDVSDDLHDFSIKVPRYTPYSQVIFLIFILWGKNPTTLICLVLS